MPNSKTFRYLPHICVNHTELLPNLIWSASPSLSRCHSSLHCLMTSDWNVYILIRLLIVKRQTQSDYYFTVFVIENSDSHSDEMSHNSATMNGWETHYSHNPLPFHFNKLIFPVLHSNKNVKNEFCLLCEHTIKTGGKKGAAGGSCSKAQYLRILRQHWV